MLSTDDQLYGQWLNVLGSTPLDSPRLTSGLDRLHAAADRSHDAQAGDRVRLLGPVRDFPAGHPGTVVIPADHVYPRHTVLLDDDPDADPVAVYPRDLEVVRPDGQN